MVLNKDKGLPVVNTIMKYKMLGSFRLIEQLLTYKEGFNSTESDSNKLLQSETQYNFHTAQSHELVFPVLC